jgi:hypothetical protein
MEKKSEGKLRQKVGKVKEEKKEEKTWNSINK